MKAIMVCCANHPWTRRSVMNWWCSRRESTSRWCRRLCAVMELVWVAWTCSVWSTSMLPSRFCWTRQPHLSNVSAWSSRTNLLSFPEHSETVGQISLQLKSDRRCGNSRFRPNAIPDAASARFQCAASPTLMGQVMLQRQPPASRSVVQSVAKSCYHHHFMAGGATVFCQFCHWLSHQLHVLSALSLQECVLDGFLAPLETILCHFGQAKWASSAASTGASVRTSPPMRGSWWPIITSRTLAWLLSLKRSFHCIIVTQFAANCDGAAFTAWYLIHDCISRVLASLQYLRLLNIKLWHAHFYSSLDDCTDLGLSYFWRKFAVQSTSIRVHTQFQLMIWMHDLSGRFTGHSTAYKLPRWLREQRCNHPKTRTVMLTRTCDHIRLDLQQHLVHKTWVFNGLRLCRQQFGGCFWCLLGWWPVRLLGVRATDLPCVVLRGCDRTSGTLSSWVSYLHQKSVVVVLVDRVFQESQWQQWALEWHLEDFDAFCDASAGWSFFTRRIRPRPRDNCSASLGGTNTWLCSGGTCSPAKAMVTVGSPRLPWSVLRLGAVRFVASCGDPHVPSDLSCSGAARSNLPITTTQATPWVSLHLHVLVTTPDRAPPQVQAGLLCFSCASLLLRRMPVEPLQTCPHLHASTWLVFRCASFWRLCIHMFWARDTRNTT